MVADGLSVNGYLLSVNGYLLMVIRQ